MGVTTNIILITTFSVLFVAGIAFAIPTVISKIGVVVKNNQGFFLSVNTFVLFLGTAIAPILMLFCKANCLTFSYSFNDCYCRTDCFSCINIYAR